ncbi:uncharacterized protein EAF01_012005 [Botrytis porri]|uniref:uncharacterized protein n=1 Tax=Botrytis porri TaxID=87229 RepID=UPI0019003BD5|nr:uncharacterized protein EAF01_012005 [Botrytis porri]KAF7880244.1 hypothetical protein EAF01_012005 [Botrytis porri]
MPRNPTSEHFNERLQAISSQITPQSASPSHTTKMAERDPITCHALDTTTGRPASGINVSLICLSEESTIFRAITNADGRIANWLNEQENVTSKKVGELIVEGGNIQNQNLPMGSSMWKLRFETGAYYGYENTFFPCVELNFVVKEGEHFHVPLLLGPYSYTTYRGS